MAEILPASTGAHLAPPHFVPARLLEKKRDGGEHSPEELKSLISAYMAGALTDYQMSAWLMAVYLRGLSPRETVALTLAMRDSGEVLTHAQQLRPCVDKHSTGGVGDKLSLPLAPLLAAAGLHIPMISGRGLGHTGGTLDKLDSIPGFRTRLSEAEIARQLERLGVVLAAPTERLAPADRRMYALRDVTGTVPSLPLIVASILSKKLAAGLDALVLDVKAGEGAFMKTEAEAEELARALVEVAAQLGLKSSALVTRMEAPLGRSIGNALEVAESIQILRCEGPPDSTELTLELGMEALRLSGLETDADRARTRLRQLLSGGQALEKFRQLIEAQGGDPRVVETPSLLPQAPERFEIKAPRAGFVTAVHSRILAEVALLLGAGRTRAEDPIDPGVGIELVLSRGARVEKGQCLALLHASSRAQAEGLEKLALSGFELKEEPPEPRALVLKRLSSS